VINGKTVNQPKRRHLSGADDDERLIGEFDIGEALS